jgi:hypothetical protein
MEQVTGIGGVLARAEDPGVVGQWCTEHLGVGAPPESYDEPVWERESDPTVLEPFGADHWKRPHLGAAGGGVDPRERDLDATVRQPRAGIEVHVDHEVYPDGRFAQRHDPEDNRAQIWWPE